MFGIDSLQPAYGRDYSSKAAMLKDWNANKDFKTPFGQSTNKADLKRMGVNRVNIRYSRLTKVAVINI